MRDGELFAWEVTYFGMPVARWEYRLQPEGDHVRLIEAVHDRRGRFLRTVSPLITGSPDREQAQRRHHGIDSRGDQGNRRSSNSLTPADSPGRDRPVQGPSQTRAVPCKG